MQGSASLGDGGQTPTSCPRSQQPTHSHLLHPSGHGCIHGRRLELLIMALMVPTGLLFLSGSDRGRQCEAFIFGTRGYLCRLCCLKGQARSPCDNRLLLLSSSKAAAKTHYSANFIPGQKLPPHPFCVEEQSRILPLLLLLLVFSFFLSFCHSWRRRRSWSLIKGRDWCFHTDLLAAGKENTKRKISFCVEASWL